MESSVTQAEVDELFWFHSFDFGNGVISKGYKSHDIVAAEADAYFANIDVSGKSVIDIGTWNGYMAFAAERRGAARVVGSDHFVWNQAWATGRRPFDLAHRVLGSSVQPLEIDVPDLKPATVGTFDVVLFLGVFYHLFEAAALTKQIASCATDLLILETQQAALEVPYPVMAFHPGATLNNDPTNWWSPNPHCMYQLLREIGFPEVYYQDNPSVTDDPSLPEFRTRGIFYAFREGGARRLGARTAAWHDLRAPERQREIFGSLAAPL